MLRLWIAGFVLEAPCRTFFRFDLFDLSAIPSHLLVDLPVPCDLLHFGAACLACCFEGGLAQHFSVSLTAALFYLCECDGYRSLDRTDMARFCFLSVGARLCMHVRVCVFCLSRFLGSFLCLLLLCASFPCVLVVFIPGCSLSVFSRVCFVCALLCFVRVCWASALFVFACLKWARVLSRF